MDFMIRAETHEELEEKLRETKLKEMRLALALAVEKGIDTPLMFEEYIKASNEFHSKIYK